MDNALPGFKVVRSGGRRVITDENEAMLALDKWGVDWEGYAQLLGITALGKLRLPDDGPLDQSGRPQTALDLFGG